MQETDVLIVGAGLAGLIATRTLAAAGLRVTLLDKGRSVGGRLATRRIGGGVADHGAQFFTVRSPEFAAVVEGWLDAGVVYRWSDGFSDGTRPLDTYDGHPRYATRGGMNALAKHLAAELAASASIRTDNRVTSVLPQAEGWQVVTESSDTYNSRALLLTSPVPQSLALLGAVPLSEEQRRALQQVAYAPCLAGLFVVDGAVSLPEPGALQRPDSPISWIADNQRKGISPGARVITVHASPDVSRQFYDQADDVALAYLREALLPFLETPGSIREAELKRWRYALPTALYPERYLLAGPPYLAFAGDAFGEARIEGAALSGKAAGAALADALKS
ncbi:MAG: FAD-dependent oxidoreductase [Anaerolineae bacterium]|nr:FAD-dependent oxidoreductase [Anaerolineae bacterium]